ncbi:MAG: TolC family protein [Verrucomicrobia subdivision 3 bacterium]|nr:TolC family protein [Limisphaerales bacterium]
MSRLILVFVALWPLTNGAQTNFTMRPLSLKDCIEIALKHNLEIKVQRYEPQIARLNVALAYADYEPTLASSGIRSKRTDAGNSSNAVDTITKEETFNANIIGLLPTGLSYDLGGGISGNRGTDPNGRFESTSGEVSLELRQPLLRNSWIDITRLTIQTSKKLLKISELNLRQQIMATVTSVELAYYDLKLAQQNVSVQEQALKLAEELLSANRQRVEQGVLAPLDEKQAESQVAAQRAILLVAQRLLAAQQNVLKSLLSDDMSEWRDILIEPVDEMSASPAAVDREGSWTRGLTLRPDLLQARLEVERLGLVVKYNRNQLYPQLDLVGSYGFAGTEREYSGAFRNIGRANSPVYSYGAILSVPLGNRAARSNYRITKAEQQQALVELQQLEQNIMLQIEDVVNLARTNFERVGATHDARLFAESALEAEQSKLENGRSTSFFVLQLQRDLTAARTAEIQALADYNKALANLALREGTVFERNKITFENE